MDYFEDCLTPLQHYDEISYRNLIDIIKIYSEQSNFLKFKPEDPSTCFPFVDSLHDKRSKFLTISDDFNANVENPLFKTTPFIVVTIDNKAIYPNFIETILTKKILSKYKIIELDLRNSKLIEVYRERIRDFNTDCLIYPKNCRRDIFRQTLLV